MFSNHLPFSTNATDRNGALLLAVAGELDIATAPLLCQIADGLLTPELRAVTLDLSSVTFVDVVGLRALLHVKEMVARIGAEFRLRSVSDLTLRIIRIVGFDGLASAVDGSSDASAA